MEESKKNSRNKRNRGLQKNQQEIIDKSTNKQTKQARRVVRIPKNYAKMSKCKHEIRLSLCHPESLSDKRPFYDLRRR